MNSITKGAITQEWDHGCRTVDDIAAAVQACATTLRYATGTRLVVDGGRHL